MAAKSVESGLCKTVVIPTCKGAPSFPGKSTAMQPAPKPEPEEPAADDHLEDELDEALEESFPASDPPAVGRSA